MVSGSSTPGTRGAFHPLVVRDVRRETRHAVCVTLAVPDSLRDAYAFRPGQYLALRRLFDGEEARRTYSICSAPWEDGLQIGVKKVNGGVFSAWANEALHAGDVIEAMPPQGRFVVDPAPGEARRYVAFAAGSGITPVLSILKSALEREPLSTFTLFYGNRASSTTMFKETLEDLKDCHLSRFNLVFVMSREHQELDLLNGRIGAERCRLLLDVLVPGGAISHALVCGPGSMIDEVSAALAAHGMPAERILSERFVAGERAPRRRTESTSPLEAAACDVAATAILDGRRFDFTLRKESEPLLDAALRQGIPMPYSCRSGICSTCRARIVEGEVDMDTNSALDDYEVERGWVLCCQSYPISDRVVVDFDQQ